MNIINIGTPVQSSPAYQVVNSSFFSGITFLDADLIFWDVNSSLSTFPGNPKTLNTKTNESTVNHLKDLIQSRKKELDEFFKIGRTLIITSPFFHKYKYSFPDAGKNTSLDFIDCFDIDKPNYERVSGNNIQPLNKDFIETFLSNNKNIFSYDVKLVRPKGYPLMYIKETKYVVSEYYKVKNGFIIILPRIKLGSTSSKGSQDFCNTIFEFIAELKKVNNSIPYKIPDWVNTYTLSKEKEEAIKLSRLNIKLNQVKDSILTSEKKLLDFRFLKALFASDGKTLEDVVEYVFQDMGFETICPENNRDDLIIKSDNNIAVIEIKGLTKSAAEKNAAQLQKWVSNYHVENNFNPKGILVVNTFKNEIIEDRTNIDFPEQMLPYANQMDLCLISGLQLLCIYLDFKSKKLKKKKVIELFFNTVGVLKYKANPMELIELK